MIRQYSVIISIKNHLTSKKSDMLDLLLSPIEMAKSRYEFMKARSLLTPL